MTTVVTIRTVEGDSENVSTVTVGDVAQKHVLRSFNPAMKEDDRTGHLVDDTKVLCAALIQEMLNLREAASEVILSSEPADTTALDKAEAQIAATQNAIFLIRLAQMQAVQANFVQA